VAGARLIVLLLLLLLSLFDGATRCDPIAICTRGGGGGVFSHSGILKNEHANALVIGLGRVSRRLYYYPL